jgi:hypothetical protein
MSSADSNLPLPTRTSRRLVCPVLRSALAALNMLVPAELSAQSSATGVVAGRITTRVDSGTAPVVRPARVLHRLDARAPNGRAAERRPRCVAARLHPRLPQAVTVSAVCRRARNPKEREIPNGVQRRVSKGGFEPRRARDAQVPLRLSSSGVQYLECRPSSENSTRRHAYGTAGIITSSANRHAPSVCRSQRA